MLLFKFLIKNSKKLFLSFCFVTSIQTQISAKGFPKEYYEIEDTNKAKEYFFEYMYKMVSYENRLIKKERLFVKDVLTSNILNIDFDSPTFHKLLDIKQKYKIKNIYTLQEYEKKVDIIPPSLALAQAALESGWGKSRFVSDANNIFGHWNYDPAFGIIPKKRDFGAKHFIRVFKSLQESVSAYMLNLNRNLAYKSFQETRFQQRIKNENPDGFRLSQTMLNYSGIAHEYLNLLKDIITINNLQNYDKRFYQSNY